MLGRAEWGEWWQRAVDRLEAMFWRPSLVVSAAVASQTVLAQSQRPSVVGTILTNQTELASVTGVYNTSQTPADLPWNTYNYCNAPHVNAEHYVKPNVSDAKLVYVNTVIRHHKVRPRVCCDG